MHAFVSSTKEKIQVGFNLGFVPVAIALLVGASGPVSAQFYQQTNLVSDVPGLAAFTVTNLVGAWGVTASSTSPWWVNSTFGGVSLLFNGAGQPQPQPTPLVVTIPPTNQATASGIVFNGGTGFELASNMPARFIFVTLNGTISGWSPAQSNRSVAVLKVDNSSTAAYTGVTIAQQNGEDRLYVANFRQRNIDVFDTNFNAVTLSAGAFSDSNIPTNFTVFNVQRIRDELYVTYAPETVFGTFGPRGQGAVDVYNANGTLLRRLMHGFWMNAPWGVVLAPGNFGPFSHHVLVGMFGNGAIAAFDAWEGEFRGFLKAMDGLPLRIEHGLWGLGFGNGAGSGATNTLYFASDLNFAGNFHGLFGALVNVGGGREGEGGDQDDQGGDQGDNSQQTAVINQPSAIKPTPIGAPQ